MPYSTFVTRVTDSGSGRKKNTTADLIAAAQRAAEQNAQAIKNKSASAASVIPSSTASNGAAAGTALAQLGKQQTGSSGGSYSGGSSYSETVSNPYANLLDILRQSYEKSLANNQTQYDNTLAAANSAYGTGLGSVNGTADKALKEAYLSNMLQKRDMKQQLTANGMSGGLSESAAAKLANAYGNQRSTIEASRESGVSSLADTLLQSLYSAASKLSERNADDAQNYFTQAAQYGASPTVTTAKSASNSYKTDRNWISDYVGVQNGKYTKAQIRQNAQALINAYGTAGYQALLSGAVS